MKHGVEVVLGSGHIVLDGDPGPSPKRGTHTRFWPMSAVDKLLHGSRCHLVRMHATLCKIGTQLPLPKGGGRGTAATQFSAYVYCGQRAIWIKMPLGTEVGLVPATLC